jgi:hypothetical protein
MPAQPKGGYMDEKLVENIVENIIEDLSDRNCLKCSWEKFDDDLKKEIRDRCKEIILKIGSNPKGKN